MKFNKVIFLLPSLGVGGAEYNAVRLSNFLVAQGLEVEAWGVLGEKTISTKFDPGVKVVVLGKRRLLESLFSIFWMSKGLRNTLFILNLWPLSLIAFLGLAFSHGTNRKLFVEHIDLKVGLTYASTFEKRLAFLFHVLCRFGSLRFVAVSDGVRDTLVKDFFLKPNYVRRIYNPVLSESLSRGMLKARRPFNRSLRILSVGNLKPQKDYDTQIRAFKHLRDKGVEFEARIAGEGPERPLLELSIARHGLQDSVVLEGLVTDTRALYEWADVFVMTSKWEGFGNVLVEALSHGCRVVCTDCPAGPREALGSGRFGQLVQVGDAVGVAEAIVNSGEYSIDEVGLQDHLDQFQVNRIASEYFEFAAEDFSL